jgi:hypothetical protein
MRYIYCLLFTFAVFQQSPCFAQTDADPQSLIKEAVQLN